MPRFFLGDILLIRVWIGLREIDSSCAGDSVEVPATTIIFAHNDMKYLMKVNLEKLYGPGKTPYFDSFHAVSLFTISMVRYFFRGSCF